MRLRGTGFIFEEKYILTSIHAFRSVGSVRTENLFASVLGRNRKLEYIDRDCRRNLCVFGLIDDEKEGKNEKDVSDDEGEYDEEYEGIEFEDGPLNDDEESDPMEPYLPTEPVVEPAFTEISAKLC